MAISFAFLSERANRFRHNLIAAIRLRMHLPYRRNFINEKRSVLPFLLIILGIAILITTISISLQPRAQTPTAQPLAAEEETFPEIPRVSLKDALAANKSGDAVFIDVRDNNAYAEAHVAHALSFPLAQLDSRYKDLDPNAWIITYCT